ncbi:MAG: TlpA family protein disulfide reductase [Nocardioidaceae bacterium]|nr:TlpA family protein disulfide reductase [Nocardioidaceae bacterium]
MTGRARRAVVVMWALLAGAGCAGADQRAGPTYTFDPRQAPVDIDTAELRKQKAAAGIEGCPVTDLHAAARPWGLPAVRLPCLGGGRDVNLAGLGGTPMVINFWAQTCGPCRTEAPLFQQLHQAAGDRLAVIGVNWQDPRPGYALAFADELGLTYPQIADPEAVTRAPMRISALPVTVFVDSAGKVTHTEYGAVESTADLAALVDDHLGLDLPDALEVEVAR